MATNPNHAALVEKLMPAATIVIYIIILFLLFIGKLLLPWLPPGCLLAVLALFSIQLFVKTEMNPRPLGLEVIVSTFEPPY